MNNHVDPFVLAALPHQCAAKDPTSGEWVRVIKGMHGFIPMGSEAEADALNRLHKSATLPSVQEAMLVGSMFGWTVPGVDPALYEKENAA